MAATFVPLRTRIRGQDGALVDDAKRAMTIPFDKHSEPAMSMAMESGRALVDLDEGTVDYYVGAFDTYKGKKQVIMESVRDAREKYTSLALVLKALHQQHVRDNDADAAMIVSVVSGKGGVGKTCACCSLASSLAAEGLRVALLDLDSTASSSANYVTEEMLDTAGGDDAPVKAEVVKVEDL